MEEKQCSKCSKIKPLDEFYVLKRTTGYGTWCQECVDEAKDSRDPGWAPSTRKSSTKHINKEFIPSTSNIKLPPPPRFKTMEAAMKHIDNLETEVSMLTDCIGRLLDREKK